MTKPDPEGDPKAENPSFEDALARLESIVGHLEDDELDLERSMTLFEEGVTLARRLEERLARAELRVEELLRAGEEQRVVPFEGGDDEDES